MNFHHIDPSQLGLTPQFVTSSGEPIKLKRTRAKRSCDFCRKRKSRCDADTRRPCTNCIAWNVQCEFSTMRKKRGPPSAYVEALEQRVKSLEAYISKTTNQSIAELESSKVITPFDLNKKHKSRLDHATSSSASTPGTMSEGGMPDNAFAQDSDELSEESEEESDSEDDGYKRKDPQSKGNGGTHDTQQMVPGIPKQPTPIIASQFKVGPDLDMRTLPPGITSPTLGKPQNPRTNSSSSDPLHSKMQKLKIDDFSSMKYMGSSAGLHLLDKEMFTNGQLAWPGKENVIIQRLNDENTNELVVVTTEPTSDNNTPGNGTTRKPDKVYDWPPKAYCDNLIDIYMNKIHATLPVVNKSDFLKRYHTKLPTPLTPFLVNAIFAVTTIRFMSDPIYHEATDTWFTPIELGKIFYARAIEHYQGDFARPRLSTVQAFIVLTLYFELDGQEDDSCQWFSSGVAIRMAQDLGLHRNSSGWRIPKQEMELRRRIWYACYVIDRWMCTQMGRPITVLDRDFDVELPSAYEIEDDESEVSPGGPKEPIYENFIQMIKLSDILGKVLKGLYATKAKTAGSEAAINNLVTMLDKKLTAWKLNLPEPMLYDPEKADREKKPCSPYAGPLHLCYYTVLLLLHRPFMGQTSETKRSQAFQARSICTNAANNIVEISDETNVKDFLSYSWTIVIYTIFQAGLVHLHNVVTANDKAIRKTAKINLQRSLDMLESKRFWAVAQRSIDVMKMLINVKEIDLSTSDEATSPLELSHRIHVRNQGSSSTASTTSRTVSPSRKQATKRMSRQSSSSSLQGALMLQEPSVLDYSAQKEPIIKSEPSPTTATFRSTFSPNQAISVPITKMPNVQPVGARSTSSNVNANRPPLPPGMQQGMKSFQIQPVAVMVTPQQTMAGQDHLLTTNDDTPMKSPTESHAMKFEPMEGAFENGQTPVDASLNDLLHLDNMAQLYTPYNIDMSLFGSDPSLHTNPQFQHSQPQDNIGLRSLTPTSMSSYPVSATPLPPQIFDMDPSHFDDTPTYLSNQSSPAGNPGLTPPSALSQVPDHLEDRSSLMNTLWEVPSSFDWGEWDNYIQQYKQ